MCMIVGKKVGMVHGSGRNILVDMIAYLRCDNNTLAYMVLTNEWRSCPARRTLALQCGLQPTITAYNWYTAEVLIVNTPEGTVVIRHLPQTSPSAPTSGPAPASASGSWRSP